MTAPRGHYEANP